MLQPRKALLLLVAVFLPLTVYAQDTPPKEPVPAEIVPQMRVNYEGVQFAFDASLANLVTMTTNTIIVLDGPAPTPPYTEFDFEGYVQGDFTRYAPYPRITIFKIEDFGQFPYHIQQLDELNRLLTERPDLNQYVMQDTNNAMNLPFLPIYNAAQVLRIKPEYIDVDGIRGIRYLTYYSQAVNPIVEGEVFYTFQGITDDGQHYVSVIMPVNTGVLDAIAPEIANYDEFANNYPNYLTNILQDVTPADGESFSPPLSALDALSQSIEVHR